MAAPTSRRLPHCLPGSSSRVREHALLFRRGRGDDVHQARRQAVVGLQPELLEPGSDRRDLAGVGARLNDRGYERRELRRRPALLARELGVDKVEPVQQLAALTAEEDEPIVVSQREGFRLLVAYRSERGLDMLREVVGITDKATAIS